MLMVSNFVCDLFSHKSLKIDQDNRITVWSTDSGHPAHLRNFESTSEQAYNARLHDIKPPIQMFFSCLDKFCLLVSHDSFIIKTYNHYLFITPLLETNKESVIFTQQCCIQTKMC